MLAKTLGAQTGAPRHAKTSPGIYSLSSQNSSQACGRGRSVRGRMVDQLSEKLAQSQKSMYTAKKVSNAAQV